MSERDTFWPDLVAALIITAGLFIMSLPIFETAMRADFRPPASDCRDQFGHKRPADYCSNQR